MSHPKQLILTVQDFKAIFKVTPIAQRSEGKGRAEATQSNKQKSRLLKRVNTRLHCSKSNNNTANHQEADQLTADKQLQYKFFNTSGGKTQRLGARAFHQDGTRSRSPGSNPTLPHMTQDKRLNFLA